MWIQTTAKGYSSKSLPEVTQSPNLQHCWMKDNAGSFHSKWCLFAAYSKKLTQVSCVARCLGAERGEAWGFSASVLWPRRDLLGRTMNHVEFHIYICVSPTDGNENGGSSLEVSRAAYHVQHCVPQRPAENQYCNLMNLRGCLLKG